jgi:hypothetical protein
MVKRTQHKSKSDQIKAHTIAPVPPSTNPAGHPVVSEFDAARYICMSRAFLQASRLGRGSGPPFLRYGRAIRYRIADLDAWLQSKLRQGNRGGNEAA